MEGIVAGDAATVPFPFTDFNSQKVRPALPGRSPRVFAKPCAARQPSAVATTERSVAANWFGTAPKYSVRATRALEDRGTGREWRWRFGGLPAGGRRRRGWRRRWLGAWLEVPKSSSLSRLRKGFPRPRRASPLGGSPARGWSSLRNHWGSPPSGVPWPKDRPAHQGGDREARGRFEPENGF